ncbi:MAG TPA: DUF6585 family protein [Ktedonobacteraceae bacterium]
MAYAPQTPYVASNLPQDVYQGAYAAQLGDQPRAEYHPALTRKNIILGVICLLIGLAFAGGGIAAGQSSDGSAGSMVILVLFGLAFIAGGIYTLLYGVIYKGWGVYVYERGFVFKKGSQAAQPFRWDQIEAAWHSVTRHYRNGIYTGTTHRYRVRRNDGYEVILNDRFNKVGELGDLVHNSVTSAKIPQVLAAYNAGQAITFGPLSVSTQGIWNGKSMLPWAEVKDISIQSGYIAVSKAGKWLRWSSQPVSAVPNPFLFIALVRRVLGR